MTNPMAGKYYLRLLMRNFLKHRGNMALANYWPFYHPDTKGLAVMRSCRKIFAGSCG